MTEDLVAMMKQCNGEAGLGDVRQRSPDVRAAVERYQKINSPATFAASESSHDQIDQLSSIVEVLPDIDQNAGMLPLEPSNPEKQSYLAQQIHALHKLVRSELTRFVYDSFRDITNSGHKYK
jgi:hypothetical protein